jgi:hypothetical protein
MHYHRWYTGWISKYKIMDIDLETYMRMNGVSEEEFKEKIEKVDK